uniref:Uncharacterized protein n=1 Tax=Arundo donax TaxID=35708 RepID=A0A0A8YBA3_ARUDO
MQRGIPLGFELYIIHTSINKNAIQYVFQQYR